MLIHKSCKRDGRKLQAANTIPPISTQCEYHGEYDGEIVFAPIRVEKAAGSECYRRFLSIELGEFECQLCSIRTPAHIRNNPIGTFAARRINRIDLRLRTTIPIANPFPEQGMLPRFCCAH